MIDISKLTKLTVGDLADYEEYLRDERKKELISMTKELYGNDIPVDAFSSIEQELKKIPNIMNDGGDWLDMRAARRLCWMSLVKHDPDITMKQVADGLDISQLESYVQALLPQPDSVEELIEKKKKLRKKPVKRTSN